MIPSFEIKRQNKELYRELNSSIKEVLARGVFILGEKVDEFEEKFAAYLGVKYAVGVASGTDALSLSLTALEIGKGDEVIIPVNSYPTAFAVAASLATPVFVDIDPNTYNIDPSLIEQAITPKTKAILPVHLYGLPCDMEAIMFLAHKYKLKVIEDCAQAGGAEIEFSQSLKERKRWKKVGSIGDAGCFSFYPTKNLGAFGDGGMVVTNNKDIYEKMKLLRMYGEKTRYNSVILGRNSRLDELQAAILLVKLKYLDKWNERRREIAKLYHLLIPPPGRSPSATFQVSLRPIVSLLASPALKNKDKINSANTPRANITLPFESSYVRHTYHLFVIRTKKRDELKAYLDGRGIGTGIHYPTPIHLQPSFQFLGYQIGDFPIAEKLAKQILSLPMFPELTEKEIEKVAAAIIY